MKLNIWTKVICFLILIPICCFLLEPICLQIVLIFLIILLKIFKIQFTSFTIEMKIYTISILIGTIILSLLFSTGDIYEKLFQGLLFAERFILLIGFGIFFSLITNPIEFPIGFIHIGIPHRYGITLMVAYRMIPFLQKKFSNVVKAQKSRGATFRFSIKDPSKFLFQMSSLIVPLIYGTLDASVKLSDALISRRYNPQSKITNPPIEFGISDILILTISIIFLELAIV